MTGSIHVGLVGKTISAVLTDGKALLIETTDNHQAVIKWGEDGPKLREINVRLAIEKGLQVGRAIATNVGD